VHGVRKGDDVKKEEKKKEKGIENERKVEIIRKEI
jgi:hypothetical protein